MPHARNEDLKAKNVRVLCRNLYKWNCIKITTSCKTVKKTTIIIIVPIVYISNVILAEYYYTCVIISIVSVVFEFEPRI